MGGSGRTDVLLYQLLRLDFWGMKNEITIKVGGNSRKVLTPESWNDLDTRTLMLFYESIFNNPGDIFSASAFTSVKLIGILEHLLGVDKEFMIQWENERIQKDPEHGETMFLEELRDTLHFALANGVPELPEGGKASGLFEIGLTEEGAYTYAAILNRTQNPWPILTGPGKSKKQGKRHYYGPSDGLDNITIYEMGMAFQYFEAYLKDNKEEHAYHLLAVLYRPGRPETLKERESAWGGDRRQALRGYEAKVAERVALVKTLPKVVQRVLLFWFASCRQQIVDAYPKVFRRDGDGGRMGVNYGWGGVLLTVAEKGPMGTLGEVSDQHYSNVLTYLSMKHDEAKEAEQRAAEAKKKRR